MPIQTIVDFLTASFRRDSGHCSTVFADSRGDEIVLST
jgi:hypothetical protein